MRPETAQWLLDNFCVFIRPIMQLILLNEHEFIWLILQGWWDKMSSSSSLLNSVRDKETKRQKYALNQLLCQGQTASHLPQHLFFQFPKRCHEWSPTRWTNFMTSPARAEKPKTGRNTHFWRAAVITSKFFLKKGHSAWNRAPLRA
jgi:hypothetical protein